MIGPATSMGHALSLQVLSQFTRDITGAVVAQQTGLVFDLDLGSWPVKLNASSRVSCTSVAAILLRSRQADDISRVIIQHGEQLIPAPSDDLKVSKIGLPQFIHPF